MQVPALFIAVVIEPPRVTAAIAMPDPTIAKIKAYSAADAPLSSRKNDFTNLTIIIPLVKNRSLPVLDRSRAVPGKGQNRNQTRPCFVMTRFAPGSIRDGPPRDAY